MVEAIEDVGFLSSLQESFEDSCEDSLEESCEETCEGDSLGESCELGDDVVIVIWVLFCENMKERL